MGTGRECEGLFGLIAGIQKCRGSFTMVRTWLDPWEKSLFQFWRYNQGWASSHVTWRYPEYILCLCFRIRQATAVWWWWWWDFFLDQGSHDPWPVRNQAAEQEVSSRLGLGREPSFICRFTVAPHLWHNQPVPALSDPAPRCGNMCSIKRPLVPQKFRTLLWMITYWVLKSMLKIGW